MNDIKTFFRDFWDVLKDTRKNFQRGEPVVYSAAIAFFTIFSLPALLIVLMLLGSVFFSEAKAKEEIMNLTNRLMHGEAGSQVNDVLDNITDVPVGFWGIFIGVVVVAKSATIIFFIIQKALNSVWQVRVKHDVKYLRLLKHRLATLAVVAGIGLLFILSLLLDTIISLFGEQLHQMFEDYFTPAVRIINTAFYLIVVLVFFTAIHKVLPDAKVSKKDAFAGGLITSVLFLIGKQIINMILNSIEVVGIYAAAGSLVVILLWVFYSAVILMLGGEVTKAYANKQGRVIEPTEIASKIAPEPEKRTD